MFKEYEKKKLVCLHIAMFVNVCETPFYNFIKSIPKLRDYVLKISASNRFQ